MSDETTTANDRAVAATEPDVGDSKRPSRHPAGGGAFPDRYEPGDELGRGGMGRVVEANDRVLGRTVALKEALDTDEEALRRFARETQITARLEHPAIVPVYDAGVTPDGAPFYVMRKVTGRPFDKLVADTKSLDQRLGLLPHVMAACQAIAHAHEHGVIHRDLKPSNIIVGERGDTVVIDWGLAKALDEREAQPSVKKEPSAAESLRTRAGSVFGTPGFMAPEQLSSSANVDERADVYAIGATLFYMLAGKPPHAGKDSDAVEAAARAAPPPPIASIAPGVPRELSTIIDKALAYDLETRYADACDLAEELSRFMTGQLVASHAYTRREKLARFVRRYRALVIVVGAALLVLAVGATIAVSRVLSARDEALAQARAAERARAAETERASDLVVSQAKLLLATNPTAAVAMVRPLANSPRWREVRAVAAGARASGVAWRLPGPKGVAFAEMSFDGMHALACGSDGSIYVYDLVKRTHAIVATIQGQRLRAAFIDPAHVLAWAGSAFTVIDVATRAVRTIDHAAPITRVDVHPNGVYFVDDKRRPWRMDPATGAITAIAIGGQVTHVAASPDGKHVAFAGEHLWLAETKRLDLVEKIHDGKKFDLSWSADGEHVVVFGENRTYDITVHPEIEVAEYGATNQSAALARGIVYSAGMAGFIVGRNVIGESDLAASLTGIYVARGEFAVAASRTGLRIFDGTHEYAMPLPWTPINALRASPRSPYIVAVAADNVLVWNLDQFMPKRLEVPVYSQIITLGAHTAWTISNTTKVNAIDLRTGEARALTNELKPIRYDAPISGAYLVGRPLANKDTLIIRPDGSSEPIPHDAAFAVVLDDNRVVLATRSQEIVIYDIAKKTSDVVVKLPAAIDRIIARQSEPRWIVATLDDGTLWRKDMTTGTVTQTKSSPRSDFNSPGQMTTAATKDGAVLFALGTQLRRWTADGRLVDHVALPRPIHTVHMIHERHVIVATDDGAGYVVDPDVPGKLARLPALGIQYSWNDDAPLLVTDDRTGGITVIDLDVNSAWKIARATPQGATPALSGDTTTVIMRDATEDATAVAIWKLDLPQTPDATEQWINEMTNATFDPRTGMLGWQR